MSLSIGEIAMDNATINLHITSKTLIYANAAILSCAIIAELYGTPIKFIAKEIIEN